MKLNHLVQRLFPGAVGVFALVLASQGQNASQIEGPSPSPAAETNASATSANETTTPATSASETNAPAVGLSETNAPAANLGDTNAPAAAVEAEAIATDSSDAAPIPPPGPAVEVELSEGLAEIVELAQSGVGEEVLISFIQNSPIQYKLTAEEIIYLTDLGIPEEVIKALLNRGQVVAGQDQAAPPAQPAAPAPPPAPTTTPSVEITATPEFEATPGEGQAVVTAPQTEVAYPSTPVYYDTFYTALAPYGSWIHIPDYGYSWRPTVALIDPGWKPYCHRGRWIYSDWGWYWQSDYTWGWAPFHYGRWHCHNRWGWVWIPDLTWGPAWVTWRYSRDYCGWAPLPPGVHFRHGFGLRYHSAWVGLSFDFGLARHCYTFVPSKKFCDRRPWKHCVPSHRVPHVYNETTIVNNYINGSNNKIINEGIGRERIGALTQTQIERVRVETVPAKPSRVAKLDRVEREGGHLVVYRPPTAVTTRPLSRADAAAFSVPKPVTGAPTQGPRPSEAERSVAYRTPTRISPAELSRLQPTGGLPSKPTEQRSHATSTSRQPILGSSGSSSQSESGSGWNLPTAKPSEQRGAVVTRSPSLIHTPVNPSPVREVSRPVARFQRESSDNRLPVVSSPSPINSQESPFNRGAVSRQSRSVYSKPTENRGLPTAPSLQTPGTINQPARTTLPSRPTLPSVTTPPARVPVQTPAPAPSVRRVQPSIQSAPKPNVTERYSRSTIPSARMNVQRTPQFSSPPPQVRSYSPPAPSRVAPMPVPVQPSRVSPPPSRSFQSAPARVPAARMPAPSAPASSVRSSSSTRSSVSSAPSPSRGSVRSSSARRN